MTNNADRQPPGPSPVEIDKRLLNLGTDVPCTRCGYDLRGLSTSSRCPECGLAICITHAGDVLSLLSPKWLGDLALGVRFCKAAMKLVLFSGAIFPVLDIFTSGEAGSVAVLAGLSMSIVTSLVGVWLVTRSPDLRVLPTGIDYARRIAHWLAAVVAIACACATALVSLTPRQPLTHIVMILLMPTGLCGIVGGIAFGLFCRHVGKLVMDPFVSRKAGTYTTIFAIGGLLALPTEAAILLFARNNSPSGYMMWAVCPILLALVAVLGGGALILSLPIYLDRSLPRIRAEAERAWREFHEAVDREPQTEGTG